MLDKPEDDLAAKLYEAAVMPELWPAVLDQLASIAGCDKAVLFATNQGRDVNGWIANEATRPLMERFISEGWAARNEISPRVIARKEPDFAIDLDLFTELEIEQSPLYQKFMIPNGLGWGTGTAIQSPSEDVIIVSLHRSLEQGPVLRESAARLTELRPHLARAAFMSSRLRLEQARAAVKAMETLGLPAVALRKDRRISIMNAHFEKRLPELAYDRHGRLSFLSDETDRFLGESLAMPKRGKTFPILGLHGSRFIGHIVPVEGAARDVFRAMDAILVLVEIGLKDEIDPRIIQSLFDLTPAEAAIAKGLILGKTIDQIALERKTSIETVRSQLKATMAKTGTSRQVDLVKLLSLTQWPPGSGRD